MACRSGCGVWGVELIQVRYQAVLILKYFVY